MNPFPVREPAARPAPPPWGRLVDEGKASPVVRFALPQHTHSFPYHAFLHWELEAGEPETLTVHTSTARVTLRGRKLAVIRDGLETGRLELVQVVPERRAAANPAETVVHAITVTPPGPKAPHPGPAEKS